MFCKSGHFYKTISQLMSKDNGDMTSLTKISTPGQHWVHVQWSKAHAASFMDDTPSKLLNLFPQLITCTH